MTAVHEKELTVIMTFVCVTLFSQSEIINPHTDSLSTSFVEFIDGMRLVIEMEADKEYPPGSDIRLHFSRFIHGLIHNTPGG